MKTITRLLIIITLTLLPAYEAIGQEEENYSIKPFQITLFPPISTNGPDYRHFVNGISVNLLWGESAGLRGVEFGGIANIEHDFMTGVQMAGVANLVHHDVKGLQFAHFANITGGAVLGGQFSGFMNISGDLTGAASAGFMNINHQVKGFQGAGFMNIANGITGVQSSGFMNIADEVKGAQLSGFMNIAGEVKGTQLGFINIADSYDAGVPLGFINIIKKGYHAFEVSGSEIWDFNFGYRMGVNRLYTQFMVGAQWDRHDSFWGFGFGLGTRFDITRYFSGSVDLMSYQLIDGGRWHNEWPNMLEQVRFTLEGRILRNLRWFIGPTFNMLIMPYEYPEPGLFTRFDPWSVYSNASGFSYMKMWPGVSGGVRF